MNNQPRNTKNNENYNIAHCLNMKYSIKVQCVFMFSSILARAFCIIILNKNLENRPIMLA